MPAEKTKKKLPRVQIVLVCLLRFEAVLQLLAIIAVLMPFRWMSEINDWMGLSALPETPVVEYMARSLSACYAWLGALTWFLSTNVNRYKRLIKVWALSFSLFGVVLLGINISSGLPALLAWGEGLYVITFGIVVLSVVERIEG